jgi:DHA1 family bicyclomycin/chloramphenicol resistance-like MFS transporter
VRPSTQRSLHHIPPRRDAHRLARVPRCALARDHVTAATPRSWTLAALLAALSMIGPFSVDLYLPSFPAIGREFAVPPIAVQQTLSSYLFAFAFMMLWHGALSDALGRRPIVLGSLVIYSLGTLGCAIAGNIESLWLFRAVQGLSAGAGVVVARAIIRDRFHGADAQRVMSRVTLVFGIAPAVGPVLGGLILEWLGWRATFWVLLGLVFAVFVWALRALPESLPPESRQRLHPEVLWRNYRTILSRIDFLLLALVPACNFCAFFIYIAAAPTFILELLGLTSLSFAWLFVPMIAGIMVGASVSGRLAGRVSPLRTVRFGYATMFVGVALNLAVCAFLEPGVPANVLPIMIFTVGSGITMPSVTLVLLDLFPSQRGMASSLQGFVQFTLSAIVAGTIAPFVSRSLGTFALAMAAFTLAGYSSWLVYQNRARAHLKGCQP